jgi:chromate reductase
MNVLGIAGSLRDGSYNRRLLEAAVRCAPAGMEVRVYQHLPAIPLFNDDLVRAAGRSPHSVEELRRAVKESDGLLIATPEYNQSIPGVLKNVLDWLSLPASESVLSRKPVAVMGASTGPWGTRLAQTALRQVLVATESRVLPGPALFVRGAERLFDSSGRLTDQATETQLEEVLSAFANWIRLLSAPSSNGFRETDARRAVDVA